jgi:ABC-type multidrug transport system fused ATPase/permease subunit
MRKISALGKYQPYLYKALSLSFLLAYFFIIAAFFLGKIFDSFHKPFWIDEIYGLQGTIRNHSYLHLLFSGATGQASPAPLDFIACKALDQLKGAVAYFGFTPEVYFRLFANGVTVLGALVVMFIFKKEITNSKSNIAVKAAQLFLLLCLPIAYLFQRHVYYYAAEMRQYALWNSLFMVVLAASLLDEKENRLLFFSLILLAFSVTASIFQLAAAAAAYFIVQIINKHSLKNIFRNEIKLLAAPFLIALYYCLRVENGNVVDVGGTPGEFMGLWIHKAVAIPLMLSVIALCLMQKENRRYAMAALTFLILFLMGPLIFLITRLKGYFYAERQFVYYELALVVFILTLIKCIPAYVRDVKPRPVAYILLILFCLIGAGVTLRPKLIGKFNRAQVNALKVLTGEIANSK